MVLSRVGVLESSLRKKALVFGESDEQHSIEYGLGDTYSLERLRSIDAGEDLSD